MQELAFPTYTTSLPFVSIVLATILKPEGKNWALIIPLRVELQLLYMIMNIYESEGVNRIFVVLFSSFTKMKDVCIF